MENWDLLSPKALAHVDVVRLRRAWAGAALGQRGRGLQVEDHPSTSALKVKPWKKCFVIFDSFRSKVSLTNFSTAGADLQLDEDSHVTRVDQSFL